MDECVCPAETYLSDGLRDEQNHHLPSGTCLDCGEGLVCELGSDMRNFEDFMQKIQTENTENKDKIYPLVQAGYFAKAWSADRDLQVWKSRRLSRWSTWKLREWTNWSPLWSLRGWLKDHG